MDIDDRFVRLYDKLDTIIQQQAEHNITLVRNTDSLEHHIRRTDLLETKVDIVEKRQYSVEAAFQATVKIGQYLVGAIGLLAAIAEIASYFRH